MITTASPVSRISGGTVARGSGWNNRMINDWKVLRRPWTDDRAPWLSVAFGNIGDTQLKSRKVFFCFFAGIWAREK